MIDVCRVTMLHVLYFVVVSSMCHVILDYSVVLCHSHIYNSKHHTYLHTKQLTLQGIRWQSTHTKYMYTLFNENIYTTSSRTCVLKQLGVCMWLIL